MDAKRYYALWLMHMISEKALIILGVRFSKDQKDQLLNGVILLLYCL